VKKTVDSLRHLNKELPAAEGVRRRQMRVEDIDARRRASDDPCPETQRARCQHPKHKSDFFSVGYPALQNICHMDVGTWWRGRGAATLFDIMRPSLPPSRLSDLEAVFIALKCSPNSLIVGWIYTVPEARTLFPKRGLPTRTNSLFI
jgi:hypothetical protein